MASYEDRILRVTRYIFDNPGGDLSLDRLADVAAMSRFHWHRVYRALTGETCAQTVRRIRLHLAATALVQTGDPVEEIARRAGYANPGSFWRAFSEAYGTSPAAFREDGRLRPPGPDIQKGRYPMHPVTIRTAPPRRLAALPHQGPYQEIGRSFESLSLMLESRGLWPQAGAMVGVYLDNPETVPDGELRSYAGVEFRGAEIPDGMEEVAVGGGRVAVLTYEGPYSGIPAATHALYGSWLPQSGEEPADAPCHEIYLNNPRQVAPERLLTEICLPLQDRA